VTLNLNLLANSAISLYRPFHDARVWIVPIFVSIILILISTKNFLLFHTLVELFSIVIAMVLSVVAWHTYKFSKNNFLLFLGTGYFWVAILELMHILSYPDLNLIKSTSIDSSMQFWVAARFSEALLLVISPFYFTRTVKGLYVSIIFGLVCLISYVLIVNNIFPEIYTETNGGTTFKLISEVVIIGILVTAIAHLVRKRMELNKRNCTLIILLILFSITSEVFLSTNDSLTSFGITIGLICKLFSYWFIFVAVVRSTLTEPYQVMVRSSSTYDAIPTPTIVIDKHCFIIQVNKSACLDVKQTRNNLIGHHCHTIFHPTYLTVDECPVCQHIKFVVQKYRSRIS